MGFYGKIILRAFIYASNKLGLWILDYLIKQGQKRTYRYKVRGGKVKLLGEKKIKDAKTTFALYKDDSWLLQRQIHLLIHRRELGSLQNA